MRAIIIAIIILVSTTAAACDTDCPCSTTGKAWRATKAATTTVGSGISTAASTAGSGISTGYNWTVDKAVQGIDSVRRGASRAWAWARPSDKPNSLPKCEVCSR